MKTTLVFTVIISFLAVSVDAWDVSGHMIVAQIAYERLNPAAQAEVKKLSGELELNGQPMNEVNIAAWADEIKHQHGGPYAGQFKNWHFIDLGCNANDPDRLFPSGAEKLDFFLSLRALRIPPDLTYIRFYPVFVRKKIYAMQWDGNIKTAATVKKQYAVTRNN